MEALRIMEEVKELSQKSLWVSFNPLEIPTAIYDGDQTWLFHHTHPPEEFILIDSKLKIYVLKGRYSDIVANSTAIINGIQTATILSSDIDSSSRSKLASIVIHEMFHVFQQVKYPNWKSNIFEMLLYPMNDIDQLHHRRLETLALINAVLADHYEDTIAWATKTIELRELRYSKLSTSSINFERGTELVEGTAQYVEFKSLNENSLKLNQDDYLPDQFRKRCYDTGHSLALLLDKLNVDWQERLNQFSSLDEILKDFLNKISVSHKVGFKEDLEDTYEKAKNDINELVKKQEMLKEQFLSKKGLLVTIESKEIPLKLSALDPMNIHKLGNKELLHSRMLKINNEFGKIDLLNMQALTCNAGDSLSEGISKIIISGINQPKINENDGIIQIISEGLFIELNLNHFNITYDRF